MRKEVPKDNVLVGVKTAVKDQYKASKSPKCCYKALIYPEADCIKNSMLSDARYNKKSNLKKS